MAKEKNGVSKPAKKRAPKKAKKPAAKKPAAKNGENPKAAQGPRQQSIPGTNIPELEAAAEAWKMASAARAKAQDVEAEAKYAFEAILARYQAMGKVIEAEANQKARPIYRWETTDDQGNQKPMKIEEEFIRRRSVKVDKAARIDK